MWRHIAANGLTLLVVLMIGAAGIVAWARAEFDKAGPLAAPICLQVPTNGKLLGVAEDLEAQGAITDARLFRVGTSYVATGTLKAGSYLITEGRSMREIAAEITGKGVSTCGIEVVLQIGVVRNEIDVHVLDPATQEFTVAAEFDPAGTEIPAEYTKARAEASTRYRISVVEGTTVWQVAEALKIADFLSGEVGELPSEGMLAPDSYEVKVDSARADVIAVMREEQVERIAEIWEGRAEGLPYDTPEEMLVMASIVEKETGVPQERPLVASVFINRLKDGMKLQTDPTVIYGITKGQGILGRGLRQSELQRDTPYNTYLIAALPPGPIANPGIDALKAAVAPETSDYLFFVADGTGGHAFAATLDEHNRNVEKWRAIEAEREAAGEDGAAEGESDGN